MDDMHRASGTEARLMTGKRFGRLASLRGAALVIASGLVLSACASSGGLFGGREPPVQMPPEGSSKVNFQRMSNSAIPVTVDDRPITKFDVDQRLKLMKLGGAKGGRKAAIEELIDEEVQMIEARRRRFVPSEAQVNAAYGTIAGSLKMSTRQLTQALNQQGIESTTLKKRLRAQIAWQRLVEGRSRAENQISTADLTSELLKKGDPTAITLTEYMLQQIIFVVPRGSADSKYTQRRREANAFRQRFQGCDTILEQTRQLKGVVVRNIGRRSSDQLPGQQGDAIRKAGVGKTTTPDKTPEGVELIAVCSAREIQSTAAARAEIQNKYALDQAEGLGKEYLKELRDRAIIVYR